MANWGWTVGDLSFEGDHSKLRLITAGTICNMTEQESQPKPKRLWLRFNLRTLLIVLTVFCVCLAWYLPRVEQQQKAVKWLRENGVTFYYDYQEFDNNGKLVSDSPSFAPKWLVDTFGVDYFTAVIEVCYKPGGVSNLTPLADLSNLEALIFDHTEVSDLTPLTGLTNLEMLELDATQIGDVAPLAGLTNLTSLPLGSTQVSDVAPLAGLTNLKKLDLRGTQVSDEDVEKLKQALPNCRIDH